MISRKPSFKRDLQTGHVLIKRKLRGRSMGLFKKRPYSWRQALIDSLILLIPIWSMWIVIMLIALFTGNFDGVLRLVLALFPITGMIIWATHGSYGNELGGCSSETD